MRFGKKSALVAALGAMLVLSAGCGKASIGYVDGS